MNLKLEDLTQDIVVVSTTQEEWDSVQGILKDAGYTTNAALDDNFTMHPYTVIWFDEDKGFTNVFSNSSALNHTEIVPAASFISANTPLSDTTTNTNTPTTHSSNT